MEKVGVLSFLHNENYGSSLQAYALQRVIRDMGYEAVHLDYMPDQKEKVLNLLKSGNDPRLILEGIRKKKVKSSHAFALQKKQAIEAFYKKQLHRTALCHNQQELAKASAGMDVLLCGSDQIWSPVWLNPAYFLCFAQKGQRKLAYAPSLGVESLKNEGKKRKIRKWVADYEALSVREAAGQKLLQELTCKPVMVLPDPVCLLSREEWLPLAAPAPLEEAYLLCYFIGENPSYWQKVEELSRKEGLKVLVLPVTAESYAQPYAQMKEAGPEAFLGAVLHASRVVTDSFHGLCFSAIFERPCSLLRRYREDDPESKNSRVDQFQQSLRQLGLAEMRRQGLDWLSLQLKQAF